MTTSGTLSVTDYIFKLNIHLDYAHLNRFLVTYHNCGLTWTKILDFNERIGFDATSTAALDTQDTTQPYFDVYPRVGRYKDIDVVVPLSYVSASPCPGDSLSLDVWDSLKNQQSF